MIGRYEIICQTWGFEMREWRTFTVGVAVVVLVAGAAFAQIDNGDFENGAAGWNADPAPNWTVEFLAQGGNPDGYARIMSPFGNSEGESCIDQEFECGVPGDDTCVISFDYFCRWIDSSELAGRVKVYLDGDLEFTSPAENDIDWTNATVTVPCGTHTIALCLEVDPGNNGWEAGFDNVVADCESVSSDDETWSYLKAIYR